MTHLRWWPTRRQTYWRCQLTRLTSSRCVREHKLSRTVDLSSHTRHSSQALTDHTHNDCVTLSHCQPEQPHSALASGAFTIFNFLIFFNIYFLIFFDIASKLSSVVESGPVSTRLTGQRQLNWSRTTTTHCSVTSWTPSYMFCINFSLPKVIITTISGRNHTIFPSLMPWTTVTSYLG